MQILWDAESETPRRWEPAWVLTGLPGDSDAHSRLRTTIWKHWSVLSKLSWVFSLLSAQIPIFWRRRGRRRMRWLHRLNGYEFKQGLGDGEGRGSLMCCSPWDRKELDTTERLNNNNIYLQGPMWHSMKAGLYFRGPWLLIPGWLPTGLHPNTCNNDLLYCYSLHFKVNIFSISFSPNVTLEGSFKLSYPRCFMVTQECKTKHVFPTEWKHNISFL